MANHEKIYGICENKCQHEVYGKTAADNQFLSKSDASNSYAMKNHASSTFAYGIATSKVYGHVRLETALNMPEQASAGIALQASAGKTLNDKITGVENTIKNLSPKIPIGGVMPVTWQLNSEFSVEIALGYGTWEYLGMLDLGDNEKNIYFYKRTA